MSSKHAQSKIGDKSSTYITDKFAINYTLGCYYMSRYLYKRLFYVFVINKVRDYFKYDPTSNRQGRYYNNMAITVFSNFIGWTLILGKRLSKNVRQRFCQGPVA